MYVEKLGFGYPGFKKFQTHQLKPTEVEPSFSHSTPCKTMHTFQRSPLGWRVLATNVLPLIDPGLKPTVQNSS